MQMTLRLWQKPRRAKESLNESEKIGLKLHIQKTKTPPLWQKQRTKEPLYES